MLSNAYFLAKFRFDTAENEPAKKLQKFANFADPNPVLALLLALLLAASLRSAASVIRPRRIPTLLSPTRTFRWPTFLDFFSEASFRVYQR